MLCAPLRLQRRSERMEAGSSCRLGPGTGFGEAKDGGAVFEERVANQRFCSDVSKVVGGGCFDGVDAAKGRVYVVGEADASLTKFVGRN